MTSNSIQNKAGLKFQFLKNGKIKHCIAGETRISLQTASPFTEFGSNIYLRKKGNKVEFTPLLGPKSGSNFAIINNSFEAKGKWHGINYSCKLVLAENSLTWKWSIILEESSGEKSEIDVVYLQDIGLKPLAEGVLNEYYVAQYLERRILDDSKHGKVLCCRQNIKGQLGHPWLLLASNNNASSACTDGMQFYGKTYRDTEVPEGLLKDNLGGEYAGESPVIALQEKPFILSEEKKIVEFIGHFIPDHDEITTENDLKLLEELNTIKFNASKVEFGNDDIAEQNLFQTSSLLQCDDLTKDDIEKYFSSQIRTIEEHNGSLLSFFYDSNNHVSLKAKELSVDRPHASIIQTKAGLVPTDNIMSTTMYAYGVFNSHITQGNTNFNILLSVNSSQFNLSKEAGQRIFVEVDNKTYLLGIPSAFECGLNHCRWIYKFEDKCFQVRTWTSKQTSQINLDFKVLSGNDVRLIISHQFDNLNKWNITEGKRNEFLLKPSKNDMILRTSENAQFRIVLNSYNAVCKTGGFDLLGSTSDQIDREYFIVQTEVTKEFCMSFIGEVTGKTDSIAIQNSDDQFIKDRADGQENWKSLSGNLNISGGGDDAAAIQEVLPWFGNNALAHFLTPHGLEQTGGAAWGTRDVNQGPVEMLLALQKYNEAKEVIKIIFSAQNPVGDWQQWWMFDNYFNIRDSHSHADIYHWCIISLSSYITATGDVDFLSEELPFYHEKGKAYAEKATLYEHMERLIKLIIDSFVKGTSLVPFGGGDWNDSLQPVNRDLAERLVSSWTVALNYQAFKAYVKVYNLAGYKIQEKYLDSICDNIKYDFNKHLIKDKVLSGFGLNNNDGTFNLLLHPSDKATGIHFRLLPMQRAIISGIFSRKQADFHLELIEKELKGPDGARLMNCPPKYSGGTQKTFQRAESSCFFGREIGIMYTHAHLRYTEAQACTGRADAFVKALRQCIPVGYRDIVPMADIRQSNCYYSSSDVVFANRYKADECYSDVTSGKATLRGGWRVYSSGPGIYIGMVISHLLGIRTESGNTIIDPVMPKSMDGLTVKMSYNDYPVQIKYNVKVDCYSPKKITINGTNIEYSFEENQYRKGGAILNTKVLIGLLNENENFIEVSF